MQGRFGTTHIHWANWFPLKEVCIDGFSSGKGEHCFVDVGGGKGHEGELVLKKYPEVRGKFVLEDMPVVIDDITELNPRIEKVAHDFTKPQPIKGKARTLQFTQIVSLASYAH